MKNDNGFDAVEMMRETRDKLSRKFMDMTFAEQKRYIEEKIGKQTTGERGDNVELVGARS